MAIGEKASKIAQGVEAGGGRVWHFNTKEEALNTLLKSFDNDTAMLVKASHAVEFEWLVERLSK